MAIALCPPVLTTASSALIFSPFLLFVLHAVHSSADSEGPIPTVFPILNSSRRLRHQPHHSLFPRPQFDARRDRLEDRGRSPNDVDASGVDATATTPPDDSFPYDYSGDNATSSRSHDVEGRPSLEPATSRPASPRGGDPSSESSEDDPQRLGAQLPTQHPEGDDLFGLLREGDGSSGAIHTGESREEGGSATGSRGASVASRSESEGSSSSGEEVLEVAESEEYSEDDSFPRPLPLLQAGQQLTASPDPSRPPPPPPSSSSAPASTASPSAPAAPLVSTDCGDVAGLWMDVSTGGRVAAFLGIPYSEPPVGDLRFRAPVPVAPWRKTKEATKFGPMCIQPGNQYVWDAVRFPTPTTPTPQHQTVRPKHHRHPQQKESRKEERAAMPEPSILSSALIADKPSLKPNALQAAKNNDSDSDGWLSQESSSSSEEEAEGSSPTILAPVTRSSVDLSTEGGPSGSGERPVGPSAPVMRRRKVRNYEMSEDCLSLNIYTPRIPSNGSSGDFPILFFIHGGSYYMNGGRLYPGEELAARGAIVVTFNYRLGAFGFLSTGEPSCRGNWGLWDQVEALKWVRRNAKVFGGDANNALCLVGNSAGAASVLLHMVSPVSKGMFSCAVAMSGCSGAPWALQPRPLRHARSLASRLGCPAPNRRPHHAVACLRTFSAQLIAENTDLEDGLGVAFAPVVDGANFGGLGGGRRSGEGSGSASSPGSGPFIPDDPRRLMAEGKFAQVPFLSGLTRDEVSIWFSNFGPTMERRLMRVFLDKDIRQLLNSTGMPALNSVALSHVAAHIYLWGGRGEGGASEENYRAADGAARPAHHGEGSSRGSEPGARGSTLAVADFISDVGLKAPCTYDTELIARNNQKASFFYEFQYHSVDDARTDKQEWIGAYHESELQFLFGEPFLGYSNHLRAADDKEVSEMLMSLWINFAKHGHPTPEGVKRINCPVDWLPFTNTHRRYLALGYRPRMAENYLTERMVFWNYIADAFRRHPMPPYCNPTPTPAAPPEPIPFLPTHHWRWVFWVMAAGNAFTLLLLGACLAKILKRRLFRTPANRSATS